jgi:Initiator Rep protein, WH2/Initiator Replication protein, WH1
MARPKKKEENEVIKASAAIQIEGKITLLQRRAWNVLLARAYDELPAKERHTVRVPDLMRDLAYNSGDQEYLKDALEALVGCKLKWNILDKDGHTEWGVAALLAGAKISRGICVYEYGPTLREKLYNPHMYARLSLLVQNRFESKHALTLWELCVDYLGAKRDCGETPWIDIDAFRKIMGIEDSHYYAALFKKLKQKVITPALTEINRLSDFSVTVEYQHKGRRVTALKFKMRRVFLLPGPANTQAPLFPELDDMPPLVKELRDVGLSTQDALEVWQQGFHYVDAATRPLEIGEDAEAEFARYIREKIHLLKRRQASGKVENITGFILEAIRKNFANPEFSQEEKHQKAAEATKAKKVKDVQKRQLESQLEELEKARNEALAKECSDIAAMSPEVLETALPGVLQTNAVLRDLYKPDRSALDNYRESFSLQGALGPYLERHAPERIQAIKDHYAKLMATVEGQIVALS